MARPVRALGIGAAALVLAALATLALPRYAEVERSTDIAAPPPTAYELLDDLAAVRRWWPWRDAQSRWLFSGPKLGVGARMEWSGRTHGRTTIEAAVPYRSVVYRTRLGGQERRSVITVTRTVQGCRVDWRTRRDAHWLPWLRLQNLWFAWREAPELDRGLDKLGDTAEALPKADMQAAQVALAERPERAFAYLQGETSATPAAIGRALSGGARRVDDALRSSNIAAVGGVVWEGAPPGPDGRMLYRIGRALAAAAPPTLAPKLSGAGVSLGTLPAGWVVVATHVGPFAEVERARAAARLYRGIHQLVPAGPVRVELVGDPAQAASPTFVARFELPVQLPGASITKP